jgi:hypothetical protein
VTNPPLAAFGKLGTCPDFVRVRGTLGPLAFEGVDQWLVQANQALYAQRLILDEPIFWIGALQQIAGEITCGVLGASRDSIGRTFPLAVFEGLGRSPGVSFSRLPYLRQSFLQHANALAAQGEKLDPAGLESGLRKIAASPESPLASIEDLEQKGAFPEAHEILRHVFGEPLIDRIGYALSMLDAAAHRPFASPAALALSCEVSSDLALFFWLELIAVRLESRRLDPTLIWSPIAQKLVINFGPPPPEALAWIAGPTPNHASLWPLQPATAESAARLAAPYSARVIELIQHPPRTLRELIVALR